MFKDEAGQGNANCKRDAEVINAPRLIACIFQKISIKPYRFLLYQLFFPLFLSEVE